MESGTFKITENSNALKNLEQITSFSTKSRITLSYLVWFFFIGVGLGDAIINYITGAKNFWFTLPLVPLGLFCIWHTYRNQNPRVAFSILAIALLPLNIISLYEAKEPSIAHVWVLLYPVIATFALPYKRSIILLFIMAVFIVLMVFPIPMLFFEQKQELSFAIRYVVAFCICSVISWSTSALHHILANRTREMAKYLENIASTDMLTGLGNRRQFYILFEKEKIRAFRYKLPLVLFISDLDFFKSINDNYGHNAGDYVLKQFALIVSEALRGYDMFFRWGGEEFIGFLPNTSLENAEIVINRLRAKIEEYPFVWGDASIRLTASFGVAEYDHSLPTHQNIKVMDDKLYLSKRNGRNCVTI